MGILVDSNLSFDMHIQDVVKKANRILGVIKRNFKFLDCTTFIMLYKSMVRSHLEYAQTVWSPYRQFNIELLEKVQRRATKIIPGFYKLPYEQRLARLNLPTLAYRRVRGDMIETFKLLKGSYDSQAGPALTRAVYSGTRGHCMKLYKVYAKKDVRKYNFVVRIADLWNSLPEQVVESQNVNAFKDNLDKHWRSQELVTNYKSKIRTRKPESLL